MFTSPHVLERSLRLLCVQSGRATSVLQPALKVAWMGELGVRESCFQVFVAPLCRECLLKKQLNVPI